jgi:hypothetical protein
MPVVAIQIQERQTYKLKPKSNDEYTFLALGSGKVYYPSYMVRVILFVLHSRLLNIPRLVQINQTKGHGLTDLCRTVLNFSQRKSLWSGTEMGFWLLI